MSKYGNIKITIDNITFDSKKEAEKYSELKLLQKAGEIKEFQVHPRFLLFKGFKKDGKKYRPIYYIADFDVTYADDSREIIDIKPYDEKTGKYLLTRNFRDKAKMFDALYPDLTLVIE